jgi:hypothetical protein
MAVVDEAIAAEAVQAWEAKHGLRAPEWVGRKAVLDSYEDGGGLWSHDGKPTFSDEFLAWASRHMGQGYSLAICDGQFVDIVTSYCHSGYVAGRLDERAKTCPQFVGEA